MNITYTGIQKELPSKQQQKIDARFAKLSKILERRGEKEAHVVITSERHLHRAEVTLNFYDHPLVSVAADGDLFTALCTAIDKLHKQALKQREKWRDNKRHKPSADASVEGAPAAAAAPAPPEVPARRVDRVNHHDRRKPMTLEEAILEMDKDRDYLVYRDADQDRLRVLVRRRDGNFDLIEA